MFNFKAIELCSDGGLSLGVFDYLAENSEFL